MTGFNVVDRTNITDFQTSARRVQSDSFGYARLGYGNLFGNRSYGAPVMGFGYRGELDSFGMDVSFLNFQVPSDAGSSYGSGGTTGSILKLEGLYFLKPAANATAYFGGGISYGRANFGGGSYGDWNSVAYGSDWHGSGLQAELTVGYEAPRASTLRVFFQADATLPFYEVAQDTYTRSGRMTTEHRYAPSLALSVGLGWQRDRHR